MIRRILDRNPDILRIPKRKVRDLPDVSEKLKRLMDEIHEYSMEDRFKIGIEVSNWIDRERIKGLLEFLINRRADGCFISGILSNVLRKGSTIELRFKRKINYIGYRLRHGRILIRGNVGNKVGYGMEGGEIVVFGDGGNWIGERMKDGCIVIKGNVENYLGLYMEGGKIIVEGNARYGVGEEMRGGEIFIKGNAGAMVGNKMRGGVIRVMGTVKSFGYRGAGRIYYWKDGRWFEKSVDYYIYYR